MRKFFTIFISQKHLTTENNKTEMNRVKVENNVRPSEEAYKFAFSSFFSRSLLCHVPMNQISVFVSRFQCEIMFVTFEAPITRLLIPMFD